MRRCRCIGVCYALLFGLETGHRIAFACLIEKSESGFGGWGEELEFCFLAEIFLLSVTAPEE